ncbi:MAG: hypothetical protein EA402_10125 [Planctomycetota bacterium]|nr:MAG: hypothetical protein EA402_10125 [Planctomycetota bacterium]
MLRRLPGIAAFSCTACTAALGLLLSCGLPVALGAAESGEALPEWLQQRPNDPQHLYGIGEASGENARELSRTLAVVDISEQLVVSVRSSRESESESEVVVDGDEEVVRLRESLRRQIRADSESHYLPGVEIVAQQRQGDTVYTLARLSRQRFSQAVQERVEALDGELEPIARLEPELTPQTLQRWRRAHDLSAEREQLAVLLESQGTRLAAGPIAFEQVRSRIGRLAQGTRLQLEGSAQAPAVRDSVLDIVDTLGLTVISDESATFQLRLRERSRSRVVGDWTRVTITGAITAVDRVTGEVIGSLEHSVEKSSVQGEEEARARAREALIEEFGKILQQRLLPLLAGQGR